MVTEEADSVEAIIPWCLSLFLSSLSDPPHLISYWGDTGLCFCRVAAFSGPLLSSWLSLCWLLWILLISLWIPEVPRQWHSRAPCFHHASQSLIPSAVGISTPTQGFSRVCHLHWCQETFWLSVAVSTLSVRLTDGSLSTIVWMRTSSKTWKNLIASLKILEVRILKSG